MRALPATVLSALLLASPAAADPARDGIVSCLGAMGGTGPTWDRCRAQMFAACSTDNPGSDTHVACLSAEADGWETYVDGLRDALLPRLQVDSAVQLTDLMGHWRGYVVNRCAAVAAANPAAGQSADLGCRISEYAGLATELTACSEGRSTEPYCVVTD